MPKIEALTVADVARRLARPKRTVIRQAIDGRLPYVIKEPGRTGPYLFAPAAIDKAAAAAGVVSVIELARELHPGDPDGHGVESIGRECFGDPDLEPDTGIPALLVASKRAAAQLNPCLSTECVAAATEAATDDRGRPLPPIPDGWYPL